MQVLMHACLHFQTCRAHPENESAYGILLAEVLKKKKKKKKKEVIQNHLTESETKGWKEGLVSGKR